MTKPLVDAGYQVFMIDFRGYGKSTGTPTHINIASDAQVIFDNDCTSGVMYFLDSRHLQLYLSGGNNMRMTRFTLCCHSTMYAFFLESYISEKQDPSGITPSMDPY